MTKRHYLSLSHLLIIISFHLWYRSFHYVHHLRLHSHILWEVLALIDIDHVRIMKPSVSPTPKRGGITGQGDPRHASVHGDKTLLDPYIGIIGSRSSIYKETNTRHAGQSHLMRVT